MRIGLNNFVLVNLYQKFQVHELYNPNTTKVELELEYIALSSLNSNDLSGVRVVKMLKPYLHLTSLDLHTSH